MSITVTCESCFTDFNVADQHAGKKVKCKSCGDVNTIPIPQRAVRKTKSQDDDDGSKWDDVDLDDATGESAEDELPTPKRKSGKNAKGSKKRSGRASGNWYDRENLIRNPYAILVGLELITALPGCVVPALAIVYFGVWFALPLVILMLSMVGGVLAAVVLNPTAMASSLLVGKGVTRHLIDQGSIKVQQESPVYDFIMKCLLMSLTALVVGLPLGIVQMAISGGLRN